MLPHLNLSREEPQNIATKNEATRSARAEMHGLEDLIYLSLGLCGVDVPLAVSVHAA